MDKEDNWGIIGHQKIVKFLQLSIARERLAQTYLFYGQRRLGKTTLAGKFAEILLRTKEAQITDLYKIEPLADKKNITIEQVREWRQKLRLKSFNQGYKVGIIFEAEKLNLESANALLKTIEEPAPQTVIIIVSSGWDKILPTIVSRSQLIRFSPVARQEIVNGLKDQYHLEQIEKILNLIGGYPGQVIDYLKKIESFEEFNKLHQAAFKVFKGNLAEKFLIVEGLLSKAEEFNKKVTVALEFLKHLKIILRNQLLDNYNQADWQATLSGKIERKRSNAELAAFGDRLSEAENQLSGNIQPRLVLENLLLNL